MVTNQDIGALVSILSAVVALVAASISWHYARHAKKHAAEAIEVARRRLAVCDAALEADREAEINRHIEKAAELWRNSHPGQFVATLSVDEATKQRIWEQGLQRAEGSTPRQTFREWHDEESRRRL